MYVVSVVAESAKEESLDAFFDERGDDVASWTDWDERTVRYEIYAADATRADTLAAELGAALAAAGFAGLTPAVRDLADRDWQEAWKTFFHWEQVSPRLAVTPPWETPGVGPGVSVIRIDPGMSFGTGQHATTRACLRWLDVLARETSAPPGFCDIGCGSGILAIGAAMLGYRPVVAMDYDPVAAACARQNLSVNGVQGVDVQSADIERWSDERTFGVVAANMEAVRLVRYAEPVARRVSRAAGSALILAGAMGDQYAGVAAAYAAQGLRERERAEAPPWISAVFVPGIDGRP